MGGFRLKGPSFTIESKRGCVSCRCTPFEEHITKDVEDMLVIKDPKLLNLGLLPEEIQQRMMRAHIDTLEYTVHPHTPEPVGIDALWWAKKG